ncbi:MAG: carbohydrate ABC transporter permease [Bacilli bacterium]|jgi:multiple sugar transport system permease protein|nr:carbohydrate ABC transporter permease [Bacilli bacterium]
MSKKNQASKALIRSLQPKKTFRERFSKENFNRYTVKAFFFGTNEKRGFVTTLLIYVLLILFGFVYVYPMLYMLSYSLMSESDLINPAVTYLPSSWYFENFKEASQVLDYWKNLGNTFLVSLIPAIFQTITCSLAGYGLARYHFPGKKLTLGLVVFTFIVPSCLTMFPQLALFVKLHLVNNVGSYYIPALLGQGIKSAVFILLFYQFFLEIPQSVVEAAKIDGANAFTIYLRIGIPSALSAFLLSLLLSTVWYYNETVLASLYFGDAITTLPLQLENFESAYNALFAGSGGTTGKTANEAIYMAGTLLTVLPLLVVFFLVQRHFVQSVDKAGVTGE